jgi:hypothetical protein
MTDRIQSIKPLTTLVPEALVKFISAVASRL